MYIPRQCVFLDGGKTIVFKRTEEGVESCEVEVGLDNTKWVAINSGLTEGDVVLLAPPANFEPAPVPDAPAPNTEAGVAAAGSAAGGGKPGASASSTRGKMPAGQPTGSAGRGGKPGGTLTAEQRAEIAKRMRERSGGSGGSGRGGSQDR